MQTLLNRLRDKGYVDRDESGMAHVFRAAVTRDVLLRRRLHELADTLCGGAATPLVLGLVQEGRFTREEIRSFHRLLDEIEARSDGAAGGASAAGPERKRRKR